VERFGERMSGEVQTFAGGSCATRSDALHFNRGAGLYVLRFFAERGTGIRSYHSADRLQRLSAGHLGYDYVSYVARAAAEFSLGSYKFMIGGRRVAIAIRARKR